MHNHDAQRTRGRQSFGINEHEVQYFIQCGFTWNYIANRLGCNRKTLYRWCRINNFHRSNNLDFTV